MSKSKLRELFINGHISYKEYIAEVDRLNGLRERIYEQYIEGNITREVMQKMLAELDRKDDLPEPPTIY